MTGLINSAMSVRLISPYRDTTSCTFDWYDPGLGSPTVTLRPLLNVFNVLRARNDPWWLSPMVPLSIIKCPQRVC